MYGLYNNYDWGYGMMGGFVGIFMMVAFWVLLGALIVWLVRETSGRHSDSNARALDILKGRYARGEIQKEEFVQKKKDLL